MEGRLTSPFPQVPLEAYLNRKYIMLIGKLKIVSLSQHKQLSRESTEAILSYCRFFIGGGVGLGHWPLYFFYIETFRRTQSSDTRRTETITQRRITEKRVTATSTPRPPTG